MKPIQQVLGLRMQVHWELPHGLAAVGQERHLLIGLHPLGLEDFEEASLGSRVIGVHEAETLGGALVRLAFADDHFKPPSLAAPLIPRMHIPAIQAHGEGRIGCW